MLNEVYSKLLRLRSTVCSLIFGKLLPYFSLFRIQACMYLTLPLKKVALACNNCAGWVGGVGNLSEVNSRVWSTDFGISYFLLEGHLTVYYTVSEFYEDRYRAARRVFTETAYRFWDTARFSCLVGRKPPRFWIETCHSLPLANSDEVALSCPQVRYYL